MELWRWLEDLRRLNGFIDGLFGKFISGCRYRCSVDRHHLPFFCHRGFSTLIKIGRRKFDWRGRRDREVISLRRFQQRLLRDYWWCLRSSLPGLFEELIHLRHRLRRNQQLLNLDPIGCFEDINLLQQCIQGFAGVGSCSPLLQVPLQMVSAEKHGEARTTPHSPACHLQLRLADPEPGATLRAPCDQWLEVF